MAQTERMEAMMRFFGFTHKQRPNELSASTLASFVGVTHVTSGRWMRAEVPPTVDLCDRLGVSFDWLVGRSSRMWSESFEATRREIRAKLARRDWSSITTSCRVGQAIDMARATDMRLFTIELVASVLRLDEATVRAMCVGGAAASQGTIRRLSEWLGVPIAWFETGDPKTLQSEDWTHPIEKAIEAGLSAGELTKMIERYVKERRDVESVM